MVYRIYELDERQQACVAATLRSAFATSPLYDGSFGLHDALVGSTYYEKMATSILDSGLLFSADEAIQSIALVIPASKSTAQRANVKDAKVQVGTWAGSLADACAKEYYEWRDDELNMLAIRRQIDLGKIDILSDLAVRPSAQGQGFGSELLRFLLDRKPRRPLLLWCEKDLVPFYQRHGMKIVHRAVFKDEHLITFLLL